MCADGVDIRDLDPEFLHDKVGLVSQEPTLFAASISESIISSPISFVFLNIVIYCLWN